MGVNAPEAPEAGGSGAGASQLGDLDSPRVADDDVADHPLAVGEDADLPGDFGREGGELASKVEVNKLASGYFAAVEPFEGANLLGF